MSIFKRKPKQDKTENNDTNSQQQEETNIPPANTAFAMRLLMKESCPLPDKDTALQIASKHIGDAQIMADIENTITIATSSYTNSLPILPQLLISNCKSSDDLVIDDIARNQMWNTPNSEELLNECKYYISAVDMYSTTIQDYKERATLLMDYVEMLFELYPSCEAILFTSSYKLITREFFSTSNVPKEDRFITYAVNVRLFNIQNSDKLVVDSLGMEVLRLPDIQYYFSNLDANVIVHHAYSILSYQFNNNAPIDNGNTIDGIKDNELCPDIKWKCEYQASLIQPTRLVLNIETD